MSIWYTLLPELRFKVLLDLPFSTLLVVARVNKWLHYITSEKSFLTAKACHDVNQESAGRIFTNYLENLNTDPNGNFRRVIFEAYLRTLARFNVLMPENIRYVADPQGRTYVIRHGIDLGYKYENDDVEQIDVIADRHGYCPALIGALGRTMQGPLFPIVRACILEDRRSGSGAEPHSEDRSSGPEPHYTANFDHLEEMLRVNVTPMLVRLTRREGMASIFSDPEVEALIVDKYVRRYSTIMKKLVIYLISKDQPFPEINRKDLSIRGLLLCLAYYGKISKLSDLLYSGEVDMTMKVDKESFMLLANLRGYLSDEELASIVNKFGPNFGGICLLTYYYLSWTDKPGKSRVLSHDCDKALMFSTVESKLFKEWLTSYTPNKYFYECFWHDPVMFEIVLQTVIRRVQIKMPDDRSTILGDLLYEYHLKQLELNLEFEESVGNSSSSSSGTAYQN